MWDRILKFSLKKGINAVVGHLFGSLLTDSGILMGLFAFLWFFYSAVADRIFPTMDTALGSSPGIVNPLAYQNGNWLVFLFPFIFFCLIILVHHLWGKWVWFGITLGLIFAFDCVVALVSSRKIHEYLALNNLNYQELWSLWPWKSDYNAHVSIVIFCGFGASFAAGMLYHILKRIVDASDADTDIEE